MKCCNWGQTYYYLPLSTDQNVHDIRDGSDADGTTDDSPVYLGEVLHGRQCSHGHRAHIHPTMLGMRHVGDVLRAQTCDVPVLMLE